MFWRTHQCHQSNHAVSAERSSAASGRLGAAQLAYAVAHRLKATYPTQVLVTLLGSTAAPLAPATALQRIIQYFAPTAQLPDDLPDGRA